MGLISKSKTWADNEGVNYDDMNANFDTLYTLANGNIENDNVKTGAAIAATKVNFSTTHWVRGVISLSTGDVYASTGKDEFTIPSTIPSAKWVAEKVEIELDTAPGSGKTITVDINKGGTTILTAPISVADTAILSTATTPSVTALSAGDRLTLDIDSVTSGSATFRVRANIIIKQYIQTA